MIPELNKEYDYFDDGKINPNRHDKVTITELVHFDKIDKETKSEWLEEVKQCHWLYNKETDYFVKGKLKETKEDVIFVRTLDNGWFSLGWWAGRLDIDGSLIARLNCYSSQIKNKMNKTELEKHIAKLEYQLSEINEHGLGDSDTALTKWTIERDLKIFKADLNSR